MGYLCVDDRRALPGSLLNMLFEEFNTDRLCDG